MKKGLRDSTGEIVINEKEAADDIKKIENAKKKLADAKKKISHSVLDDEKMYGAARNAYEDKISKIIEHLDKGIEACDSTVKYINKTVELYKDIDRSLANSMGDR